MDKSRPRKLNSSTPIKKALNAPEYIPAYLNEVFHEEQDMKIYDNYLYSFWHPEMKQPQASIPQITGRLLMSNEMLTSEFTFESSLQEKENFDGEDHSVVGSESNSVVESLFTQSSKGSGIHLETSAEERRLEQRQKQIDYGKNTIGYVRYTNAVPRDKRRYPDPETPDKYARCSKRAWDGLVRNWRRKLHQWDPPTP